MHKHLLMTVLLTLGFLAMACGGASPPMPSAPAPSAAPSVASSAPERESAPPPRPAPAQPAPAALDIDAYVDSLPTESLAFNAPDRLLITETATVRLRLEPGLDGEAASAAFEATRAEDQPGEIRVATSVISPEMEASLTAAEGIEVRALTRERQAVSRRDPTEWLWEIKAVSGGSHRLMLSVYAFAPGGTAGRKVKTVEELLLVEVPVARRITGFLGDNWEWLWTLLGAPLGAWLFARWRHRRGQEPPAAT